jgi:hypothetical protein
LLKRLSFLHHMFGLSKRKLSLFNFWALFHFHTSSNNEHQFFITCLDGIIKVLRYYLIHL